MTSPHRPKKTEPDTGMEKAEALAEQGNNIYSRKAFLTAAKYYRRAIEEIKQVPFKILERNDGAEYLANLQSNLTQSLILQAHELEERGEFQKAIENMRAAIQEFKSEIKDFKKIFSRSANTEDLKNKLLKELLNDELNLCVTMHTYSRALFDKKKYEESIEQDNFAITELNFISISPEIDPHGKLAHKKETMLANLQLSICVALNNHGIQLEKSNKFDEAIKTYKAAIKLFETLNHDFLQIRTREDRVKHNNRIARYKINLYKAFSNFAVTIAKEKDYPRAIENHQASIVGMETLDAEFPLSDVDKKALISIKANSILTFIDQARNLNDKEDPQKALENLMLATELLHDIDQFKEMKHEISKDLLKILNKLDDKLEKVHRFKKLDETLEMLDKIKKQFPEIWKNNKLENLKSKIQKQSSAKKPLLSKTFMEDKARRKPEPEEAFHTATGLRRRKTKS